MFDIRCQISDFGLLIAIFATSAHRGIGLANPAINATVQG